LAQCGATERSVARLREALEVAQRIDHPYSVAYALHHNGLLAIYRGRFEEALQHARELSALSHDNDFPVWHTLATVFEGVATCLLGDPDTGLAMTEKGIELYHGLTAPPVFWPQLLSLRAIAHGVAGRPERGLELIDEALAILEGDVVKSAEVEIVKGDLLLSLAQPDHVGAENSYLAAANGASLGPLNMFHLQALNRLVALRREQGVTPDGSEELAAVYATFTEGFEEHDLARARDLLSG
jgi:predicted ATPase